MSATEQTKQSEDAFSLFDLDGNGTIDETEIKDLLEKLGVTSSSHQLMQVKYLPASFFPVW